MYHTEELQVTSILIILLQAVNFIRKISTTCKKIRIKIIALGMKFAIQEILVNSIGAKIYFQTLVNVRKIKLTILKEKNFTQNITFC